MLASVILTDVQRELLELGASNFWSQAELIRHLNRAELDYSNKTRCLESSAYTTLVVGQKDYPLPSDCISVRLMMHNKPGTDGSDHWQRVFPTNLEKIAQEQPNFLSATEADRGSNQGYYIWNNSLYVQPSPDTANATQVWLYYKAKPIPVEVPGDSINLPEELSEAITEFILWKAWMKEGEEDKAEAHHVEYARCIGEGRKWLKKRSSDQKYKLDIESPENFNTGTHGFDPLS